jgi:hypothetical protein
MREKLMQKLIMYAFNSVLGFLIAWQSFRFWSLDTHGWREVYNKAYFFGLIPFVFILTENLVVKQSRGWLSGLALTVPMYLFFAVFWLSDGGSLPFGLILWISALAISGVIISKLVDLLRLLLMFIMARKKQCHT